MDEGDEWTIEGWMDVKRNMGVCLMCDTVEALDFNWSHQY